MNDFTKDELELLGACVFSKFVATLDDPSIRKIQPDLEKLRDKLQSLIDNYCEPKPKFKVGQVVWRLNYTYDCTYMRIADIDPKADERYYGVDEMNDDGGDWWTESQLYPTREALIQSQIKHWLSQSEPELPSDYLNDAVAYLNPKSSCCSVHAGSSEECREECEHEWYGGESYGDSAERKCKLCGEFYL